jgi:DNA-binding NarL/FixJ family response regulator
MTLVVLEDDLLFLSRIREAAGAQPVRVARSTAALLEACRADPAAMVVADLDSPRLRAVEAIRALRQDPAGAGIRVVGFFSHVHAERAQEAIAAGADQVLPRSAFVRDLPSLVAAPPPRPGPAGSPE